MDGQSGAKWARRSCRWIETVSLLSRNLYGKKAARRSPADCTNNKTGTSATTGAAEILRCEVAGEVEEQLG